MRAIPANLAAALASGATTLATFWRVARRDGLVLGFTDHDRNLVFAGTTYLAQGGLSGTAWARTLGLAVDTLEVVGALTNATLTEATRHKNRWTFFRAQFGLPQSLKPLSSTHFAAAEQPSTLHNP